jgi:signal transduction histidine kinase/ActR/RegA family two-component response regulator
MSDRLQQRVLVLAQGRDATLTRQMLLEGKIETELCTSVENLYDEIESGAALAIVAQEFLAVGMVSHLQGILARQPRWSDLPIIVVAGGGESVGWLSQTSGALGNVSVLQRPIALDTFLTTVQTALRARRRQYEIRDLLAEQQAADRRKDEFLAMLAHELRNPLSPIRSAVEVMSFWHLPEPEQREVLDIVRRQVSHMAHLLDDLLDVSRITRGKISLDKQVINLLEIIENAIRSISPLMAQKRHTFQKHLPSHPILITADPTRVHQIVSNLLHNAAKYTNPGGRIKLNVKRDDHWAIITICDNGTGIAPTVLPQIFDLFMQEERPLDRTAGGLGIGLTVVKSLVELHGGTVTITSDGPDCGTEVVVKLPAISLPKTREIALPMATHPAVVAKRILVVDDNADGAQTLARLVSAWGHTVRVEYEALAGLRAGRDFRPDVYLLDIGLPGMDGYELARQLRNAPWFNGARLIAVSGYGQASDREMSQQVGFHAHLVKPVDPIKLREELQQAPSSKAL